MGADLADGPPGSESGVPDLCPLPPIHKLAAGVALYAVGRRVLKIK
jgi:hypothetical protein